MKVNLLRVAPMMVLLSVLLCYAGGASAQSQAASLTCASPPPDLVSWWPGNGNANDIKGTNHGTLQNGATFASGQVGQAFSLDGTDDFVNVPDSPSLDAIQPSITVDAWIKPQASASGQGYFFARRQPFQSESFSLSVDNTGRLRVYLRTVNSPSPEGSAFGTATGVIKLDQFQHVAVSYDASTGTPRAYVDGQTVALSPHYGPTTVSGSVVTTNSLFIGRRQSADTVEGQTGARYYKGLIDEIEIFDRALSQQEIECRSNLAPNAVNDEATVSEDTAVNIGVLLNDSDPNGDALTIAGVSAAPHGTATVNADNTVRYVPDTDYVGPDSFTYTISDGKNGADTATVTVAVTDATPPALSLPPDITKEATGPNGAAVQFSATATDKVDGNMPANCKTNSGPVASGATFPLGTTRVTCRATDNAGNTATGYFDVTVRDTTPPTISGVPADITVKATSASGAIVAYPSSTANDVVDGSVDVESTPASGTTFPLGITTVDLSATDSHGNTANESFRVRVIYDFAGFFSPVDNPGPGPDYVFNVAKAGSSIPLKFSLGGNMGLQIFEPGYPKVQSITCPTSSQLDPIEETVTASQSGLTYDATIDRYHYVWKTDKTWTNTCRKLMVRLNDGTEHTALFKFT